jgi:hypothetical protein
MLSMLRYMLLFAIVIVAFILVFAFFLQVTS